MLSPSTIWPNSGCSFSSLSKIPRMRERLRFVSARMGYSTPSIPPLSFGVFNQAKCTSLVSQEAPNTSVLRFSNSAAASWKACSSVGHTNVKSFGYQNNSTFFPFFVASSKILMDRLSPMWSMALTAMLGNFFPVKLKVIALKNVKQLLFNFTQRYPFSERDDNHFSRWVIDENY